MKQDSRQKNQRANWNSPQPLAKMGKVAARSIPDRRPNGKSRRKRLSEERKDLGAERAGRREFLTRCTAAAAAGLFLGQAAEAVHAPAGALPTITLGRYRISRLIVGANPIAGYSYLGHEMDQEMKAWYTPERILDLLRRCEREGINTHQFSPL